MRTMILLLGGTGLLVGCAAPGPPLPPLLGPGPWGGIAWILLAAIGVGIYLLPPKFIFCFRSITKQIIYFSGPIIF